MKLHLPKMLTAALIAASTALIAGQQAQAGERPASQLTDHTTTGGGVTYNGYVFTMQLDKNDYFASRNFKEATYNTGTSQWVDGETVYASGNSDIDTPLGRGYFWRMYCSANLDHAPAFGTTLRLAGATSETKLQTDFSDFTIGGLIAEGDRSDASASKPTYWLYRNHVMDINGLNDVNMDINSHVMFSYEGSINLKKGGTWNIHEGKVLTFNNNSTQQGKDTAFIFYENQALTVKGGGTLALETRPISSGDSVVMRAGSSLLVTGEGTTVKLGNGSAGMNTINGTITVETGSILNINANTTLGRTITNAGTLTVASGKVVTLSSDLNGFDHTATYVDYNGSAGNDGFAGNLYYTIVKNTGTLNNLSSVKLSDGTTQVLDAQGGFSGSGNTDYTTYNVNTDSVTISVKSASDYAAEHGGGATLTTVYVKGANDTVNVDANFNGTVEVTGTGAVLNIKEDSTFSGTLTAGTLQGAGTYALASGTDTLGSSVTLAPTWTGTVKLSNITTTELDLNKYGNANSVVEIDNWSSFLKKSDGYVYYPKLRLTGAGMTVSDGYSNYTYEFAGGVEGTGNFKFQTTTTVDNQTYIFSGDVSQWTGAYEMNRAGKTTTLKFLGNAEEMGAAIKLTAGSINIVVGDGEAEFSTVFDKAVAASKLTINDLATATFKDETSIGTLEGAGSLIVDADTHTVAISGGAIANTIDLQTGTLSLAGAYNLDAMEPTDYNEQYVGPESFARTDSGFHQISGTVQVVNIGGGTLSLAEGATFSYEEADVTVNANTGVGSFSGVDLSTLWVNSDAGAVSYDAAQEYAEEQASGTIVGTVRLNYDGATVAMDRADASVALVLSDEATAGTVYATENTTISSISGWSGKTLTIDGSATVSTPAAVVLDEEGDELVVEDGATLAITGKNNLTLQHGTATINGTVTIGHELDLSKGYTSDAELVIGTFGDVTATDGLWLRGGHHFTILDDGQFTTKGLTFIGQGDDSTIALNKVASEDANYSTTEDKFVITNMTIQANQDVTIGNTLDNSTVVTGDHAVTLNSGATSVIVSDGGTFTKGEGATVGNITVEGCGTIAGEAGIDEVTIDVDATATFNDQSFIGSIEEGVYMYSIQTPIVIHNGGEEAAKYTSLHQNGMEVFAETLSSAADDLTVENTVAVGLIQHQGAGSLTLAHVNAEPLDAVEVTNGSLILQDVPTVTLSSMEIASGSTVAVYTDEQAATEGTVTITESLTAGGAALYADLTLVGRELGEETPLLFWDLGGQQMTLGSTLTLDTETGLIQLDNATMQQIAALTLGGNNTWALVLDAPGGTGLEYIGDGWFDGVFSRTYTNAQGAEVSLGGDYRVQMLDSTSFGIVKVSNTPEPTTGTLSLLALAALAARRRRK